MHKTQKNQPAQGTTDPLGTDMMMLHSANDWMKQFKKKLYLFLIVAGSLWAGGSMIKSKFGLHAETAPVFHADQPFEPSEAIVPIKEQKKISPRKLSAEKKPQASSVVVQQKKKSQLSKAKFESKRKKSFASNTRNHP